MIGIHVKTRSYAELARKRAKDATFRNLNHAAATLRLTAQRSLRKRKTPSAPGQPPSSFTGRLRKSILYAVDRARDYAVIGPSRNLIGPAGAAHERGGRFRGADYPARPYMGPALEKIRPRLARLWAGSVR
jgi:phage gpG-like protein